MPIVLHGDTAYCKTAFAKAHFSGSEDMGCRTPELARVHHRSTIGREIAQPADPQRSEHFHLYLKFGKRVEARA